MNERDTLTTVLWVLSVTFFIKAILFDTLAGIMFRQDSKTGVGKALRWHYLSIGTQAVFLILLYAHYARALDGHLFLPYPWRMGVYVAIVISAVWVVISGLNLLFAYWMSRSEGAERTRLQDVRDDEQQDREDSQQQREDDWELPHGRASP